MVVALSAQIMGIEKLHARFSPGVISAAHRAALFSALQTMANEAQKSANERIYSREVEWERSGEYGTSLVLYGRGNIHDIDEATDTVTFGSSVPEAAWVEDGTPPRTITPRDRSGAVRMIGKNTYRASSKQALSFQWHGQRAAFASVNHPGNPGLHILASAMRQGNRAIGRSYTNVFAAAVRDERALLGASLINALGSPSASGVRALAARVLAQTWAFRPAPVKLPKAAPRGSARTVSSVKKPRVFSVPGRIEHNVIGISPLDVLLHPRSPRTPPTGSQ